MRAYPRTDKKVFNAAPDGEPDWPCVDVAWAHDLERENEILTAANSDVKRIAMERNQMRRALDYCLAKLKHHHGTRHGIRAVITETESMANNPPPAICSATPHKCPICEGHGNVPGGFYSALPGCGWASSSVSEPCRACGGSGVIYTQQNNLSEPRR